MKVFVPLLVILFLAILTGDCLFIINKMPDFRFYTKPLLMPVLYIMLALQTVNTTHKHSKLYVGLALFFCFLGDFLLLNNDNSYFIMGLCSFLLGHICYSVFFLRLKNFSIKRVTQLVLVSFVIIGYLFLILNMLWQGVTKQGLAVPVVIYAVVIGFMTLTACQVAMGKRLRKLAWQNLVPGAILFIVSDSLLAVEKFTFPGKQMHTDVDVLLAVGTMLCYGIAQLMLVWGAIRIIKK